MLPWLECQKTDCCCRISSRNSGLTVDELPSPPCSGSTLISAGLFTKNGEKKNKNKERTDRNPFVSLRCDHLHGDEGPECSAVFTSESQTIEPVFVLPREVWGQKRREEEEKGRSSVEGITHCENHAHSLLLLWWLNCFPVPGYLVKQILFPYTPRWYLLMAAGDKWLGGRQNHTNRWVWWCTLYIL